MQPALSTGASSGIPAGLRRKPVEDDALKAAKGHAAGVMFVAPDGEVLLLRRGGTPGVDNFVGHWALPGGGVEEGETPEIGADREVGEEMGVQIEGKKKLLDQRITPTGMAFHTFAQPVTEKFVPTLNDEHTGYAWAPLDMLPQPLHPAVQKTLTDRLGTTDDMKPEDWKGLREGFLKWAAEEEAEPEHADDELTALDAGFNESDHPRAENGEFGSGGSSGHETNSAFAKGLIEQSKNYKPAATASKAASKEHKSQTEGVVSVGKTPDTNAGSKNWALGFQNKYPSMKAAGEALGKVSEGSLKKGHEALAGFEDPLSSHVRGLVEEEAKKRGVKLGSDKNLTATDSALTLALDRDSVRVKDGDGRMNVKTANISKATVNPYLGEEIPGWEELGLEPKKIYQMLRDPEELRKSAASFNGVQLLRKHIPVSAEDHQPYDVVGTTGTDAKFDHPYLTNSLHVWTKEAIDEIESDGKKELSCGYHYRPEMTAGNFDGMRYDGVMRDIVGNHVALVKDGRAGPDVVVGDSMEKINMSKPTRFAALALSLAASAVTPVLAKDAKIDLMPVFKDVTSKNFDAKKIKIALDSACKGKLAKDADFENVGKVLDALAGLHDDKGVDQAVSPEQEAEMKDVAAVEGDVPAIEQVSKDAEPLKAFLKEKGMADDDIAKCMDMMPKAAGAMDESEEDKKKREEMEKTAKDAQTALAAKDKEMEDMVKKPAMDAAIKIAVDAAKKEVRDTERGIRAAIAEVEPIVGDLAADLVFDSADAVRGKALEILGIDTKGIPPTAFGAMLKLAPKPGAKPSERQEKLGMDAAGVDKFNSKYPGAANIGAA